MKVYASPVEFAEPDYANYDFKVEQLREQAHQVRLKIELKLLGYNGPHTGRVVRFPVADGYAQYMIADAPGKAGKLIHLPYGDAYQYPDVQYLPKSEIIKRADQADNFAKLFAKSA